MGKLAQSLGVVPRNEWDGLHLEDELHWEVESCRDSEKFLRALPLVLPPNATLYFEGTVERSVEDFLAARQLENPERIAIGTIWPRPKRYHVPFSSNLVSELAALVDSKRVACLCTHVHAYVLGLMLLEWHDAFGSDPIRVSSSVAEPAVHSFANQLGKSYRRHDA